MEHEEVSQVACMDCGLPYEEFPLDVILPRSQWLDINPADGGVLCAGCIVKRAAKIPGCTVVHAILEISPRTPTEQVELLTQQLAEKSSECAQWRQSTRDTIVRNQELREQIVQVRKFLPRITSGYFGGHKGLGNVKSYLEDIVKEPL